MDIDEDTHYRDYITTKNPKQRTEQAIYQRLTKYFTYINKTPTNTIEEAEQEEDNNTRMKRRKIKQYLTNYLDYLIKKNYSENYIKASMGTVRNFYTAYDIEVPRQYIKVHSQERQFSTDDIIQKNHIQEILKVADPKWKAIVLLMASSGMGAGEIRSLKVEDFKNGLGEIGVKSSYSTDQIKQKLYKNKDAIIIWKIRRIKTNMPYFCFSSHESTQAIVDYLAKNKTYGRKYLFTNRKGQQLTPDMITYHFGKLNNIAGFGYVEGKRFFHSHGLRKFFASTLYKAGLAELTIQWLLGHKIDKVTEAYFKADINKLKSEYIKVLPDLTFTEKIKVRVVTDEKLKELEEEIKEMKETIGWRKWLESVRKENEED